MIKSDNNYFLFIVTFTIFTVVLTYACNVKLMRLTWLNKKATYLLTSKCSDYTLYTGCIDIIKKTE